MRRATASAVDVSCLQHRGTESFHIHISNSTYMYVAMNAEEVLLRVNRICILAYTM